MVSSCGYLLGRCHQFLTNFVSVTMTSQSIHNPLSFGYFTKVYAHGKSIAIRERATRILTRYSLDTMDTSTKLQLRIKPTGIFFGGILT